MATIEREVQTQTEAPAKVKHPEYLRAAQIIRERGWIQDVGEGDHGEVCLAQAHENAMSEQFGRSGGDVWTRRDYEAYEDSFDVMVRAIGSSQPWEWNDEPGRTKEEVIEALERMAYDA